MQQIDSEDANFLFMEKVESPTHISLVYLYDQSALGKQQVRFSHIKEHVHNRLNSAPIFTQKIRRTPADIDYPYWVNDEKFDLDFHVRHLALPQPGDWRQFCILTSRLHSRPLDMSRPLWELYVIEGLDNVAGMPANSFAIFFKVHHALVDGANSVKLLNLTTDPRSSFVPPFWADTSRQPPERRSGSGGLLQGLPGLLDREIKSLPSLARGLSRTARAALGLGDDADLASIAEAPRTIFNVHVGG